MKTPDQEVAEKIFQQFRARQLLSEKGIQKIGSSLPNGTLNVEDWRLLFEIDSLHKEADSASESQ